VDVIVVSPLQRAIITASMIAADIWHTGMIATHLCASIIHPSIHHCWQLIVYNDMIDIDCDSASDMFGCST
jgi:hypothetical protein